MTFNPFAAAALATAGALALSSSAFAQAAPPVTHGPPINGVCIVNIEGAIGGSTVGKYVDTRLQQIAGQVNAELNGERSSIETEGRTLETQRATLDQNTVDQRNAKLQVDAAAFQRKAQLREREMQATEQKALQRVGQEMEPLIRQVYQQKGCSLLLQRTSVVLGNPAMDITPQVVAALNAKFTTFAFDREHLDQPTAAGAPPPTTVPTSTPTPARARPASRR
jgi:outer membrane protein